MGQPKRSYQPGKISSRDICKNNHKNHPNSNAAFERSKFRHKGDRLRIYNYLLRLQTKGKGGRTCQQIERVLKLTHETCSARISELKAEGWLIQWGKRKTKSGGLADIHWACETRMEERI